MQEPIEAFLEDVEASKAENTHAGRKTDMRHYDEWLDGRGVSAAEAGVPEVHKFLIEQGAEYADGTVGNRYSSLKLLYDFLASPLREDIEESPFEDDFIEPKKYGGNGNDKHAAEGIVYVTPDEVETLRENVGAPRLRNDLLIKLLFQTGLRRGELSILEKDDVDREAREIEVWAPKTETRRTVYYQPSLDFLVDQWLDAGYRDSMAASPYLFPTNRSESMSTKRVNEVVKTAAENAGLQEVLFHDAAGRPRYRITAHALRHGHAVEALKSGVDIRRVQIHMGHEKIETTMKYLPLIDRDVKVAYQRFGTRPEGEA